MKSEETGAIVRFILAAYPTQRQRMSSEDIMGMYAAYGAALASYAAKDAQVAVSKLSRSAKWMPTIAEICERIEADQPRQGQLSAPPEVFDQEIRDGCAQMARDLAARLVFKPTKTQAKADLMPLPHEIDRESLGPATMINTKANIEKCGECAPCRAGSKVCSRVLLLSPEDEHKLQRIRRCLMRFDS